MSSRVVFVEHVRQSFTEHVLEHGADFSHSFMRKASAVALVDQASEQASSSGAQASTSTEIQDSKARKAVTELAIAAPKTMNKHKNMVPNARRQVQMKNKETHQTAINNATDMLSEALISEVDKKKGS
eukprot:6396401-Amphidinium_carterae.2